VLVLVAAGVDPVGMVPDECSVLIRTNKPTKKLTAKQSKRENRAGWQPKNKQKKG
jgi:hypothetical protein